MSSPGTRITTFVLEKLHGEPVSKRAELYRDLAAVAASTEDRLRFQRLADDCEAIVNAHDQLVLDFKRRTRR